MKQLIADLPKERLTPYDQPFTYMGVDFFRPFYVKRGRGRDKIYGCLFTSLTSRTVHIEDSRPLTTDDRSDPETLTLNHPLLQSKQLALPPGLFVHEDFYRRKQWRRAQFLDDYFLKKLIKDYVPTLQQRQNWIRVKGSLKVDDLVLMVDKKSLLVEDGSLAEL
ncbi:hypothetical protein P5673_032315 [Acropora cervicornis]|uniref:DUF5641 domain-containing protein n=1 Tax=Acropora cervicornis TaxID=6130 RepID=A0AAD9PRC8_ACRCE|nr:hypothetical protein P5673_032315 [Acropora cervicornis]